MPHGVVSVFFTKPADFQATAGAFHGQRGWADAAAGGAGGPTPRTLQAHLQALLQGAQALPAGLQEESGWKYVCPDQCHQHGFCAQKKKKSFYLIK